MDDLMDIEEGARFEATILETRRYSTNKIEILFLYIQYLKLRKKNLITQVTRLSTLRLTMSAVTRDPEEQFPVRVWETMIYQCDRYWPESDT